MAPPEDNPADDMPLDREAYEAFLRSQEDARAGRLVDHADVGAALEREIPPPDSDSDRARRFKRMACSMAAMIDWPSENAMMRAGGDVVCTACGLPYIEHPQRNGLHLICTGALVKL